MPKSIRTKEKLKRKNISVEEIKAIRQENTLPILNNFKQWLEQEQHLVSQKPPIAKTMNCALRHWIGLVRFCEDGRYLIDNNQPF